MRYFLILLLACVSAISQPVIQTTTYTRDFLVSPNAATARSKLGVGPSTNAIEQLNGKGTNTTLRALTVVGSLTNSQATASRAALFNSRQELTNSPNVSDVELEYLDGVTSAIQTQLNSKAPSTTGTSILKGDGSGGTTAAIIGTDFNKTPNPNASMWEDEFLDAGATSLSGSKWTVTVNSGQWANLALAGHYGIKQFSTLASSTAAPLIALYASGMHFGTDAIENGFYIHTPAALSDGTDTYMIFVGFGDATTSALSVDGAYIIYRNDINSGKWTGVTSNNSVTNVMTGGNGGTTVVISTWYLLQTKVNAAGTLVSFYVDGVLIGTSAAQIPTGVSRALGAFCQIVKSGSGTTARTMEVDYYYHKITFTAPRFTLAP